MNFDLINRKNKFIKWTSNEDTLNFPKPRKLNFEPQG